MSSIILLMGLLLSHLVVLLRSLLFLGQYGMHDMHVPLVNYNGP